MCEYWKSVPMWRCPYCKCTIQDTKAARQFHENGKRHREAVERHRTEVGVRGYQKERAQEDLAADLRKIEAAALSSYMAHDVREVSVDIPDRKSSKARLREELQTVSSTTSSTPEYGTKEYAEWYYALKRQCSSEGNDKAMKHIAPPVRDETAPQKGGGRPKTNISPSKGTAPLGGPSAGKGGGKEGGKGGGMGGGKGGGKEGGKGRYAPKAPPSMPTVHRVPSPPLPPEEDTSSSSEEDGAAPPVPQPRPPPRPPRPFSTAAADDELEDCSVGWERDGLRMSGWTTVAVRPLSPVREEEPAAFSDAEDEEEGEGRCPQPWSGQQADEAEYQALNFNFSKTPNASDTRRNDTGFRVTTLTRDDVVAVKQEVKPEPSEGDREIAARAMAAHLTPLAERAKFSHLLPAVKPEPVEHHDTPETLKRLAGLASVLARGKRQFRRKTGEE